MKAFLTQAIVALVLTLGVTIDSAPLPSTSTSIKPPDSRTVLHSLERALETLYAEVNPSVVNIRAHNVSVAAI